MIDNWWPLVSPVLQLQRTEQQRAWLEAASKLYPNISPWPKRRSRKRRPDPGVYDAPHEEG